MIYIFKINKNTKFVKNGICQIGVWKSPFFDKLVNVWATKTTVWISCFGFLPCPMFFVLLNNLRNEPTHK